MKKTILTLAGVNLIFSLCLVSLVQAAATSTSPVLATTTKAATTSTKTTATTTKATTTPTIKTTASSTATTTKAKIVPAPKPIKVVWTSAALRLVNRIPRGVRPAYKKKVENYARRNNIKTITPKVVNDMRE